VFNPKDTNTFASASLDRTVKVWSIGQPTPNFTLEGHEKGVNAVDYFQGACCVLCVGVVAVDGVAACCLLLLCCCWPIFCSFVCTTKQKNSPPHNKSPPPKNNNNPKKT
jgi:WD40 repeat protein